MISHFDESIITGTRAISGSAAIRCRNLTIAAFESSIASSMLTSMICAPFATCCRAISTAPAKSPARISLANARDPVTLVRSPILTNSESSSIVSGSRPASLVGRDMVTGLTRLGGRRHGSRPHVLHGFRDRPRHDERKARAVLFEVCVDRKQRGLGVERIEDRLDQQ